MVGSRGLFQLGINIFRIECSKQYICHFSGFKFSEAILDIFL